MVFKLTKITHFKLEQVIKFANSHFLPHEVMTKHLKISTSAFTKTFTPVLEACYRSGFSYAAHRESELVSVVLKAPYVKIGEAFSKLKAEPELNPIIAILSEIQKQYKPEDEHKTMCNFIGCTHHKYKGNRLMQKLHIESQKEILKHGYTEFCSDSTSHIPQRVLKKLNYQELRSIDYRKFEHDGQVPFRNLTQTNSLKLMVKKIRNAKQQAI